MFQCYIRYECTYDNIKEIVKTMSHQCNNMCQNVPNDSQMPIFFYQTKILDSLALYDVFIIYDHTCDAYIFTQQIS